MMLPTAPMPVQTAYAVPKGRERSASAISVKLSTIATAVPAVGQNRVSPSEYLRPSAQATSSSPAMSSASHAVIAFAPLPANIPAFVQFPKGVFDGPSLRCSRDRHVTEGRF